MPSGGLVGILVGALSGPLGVLFGRSVEGFTGHGGGLARKADREVVLEQISRELEPGITIVIAEIGAEDPDALDKALSALDGTVTRRPAEDVYAEVQAAEEAASAADDEARRVLREQRREERKDKWEQFKETVRSKLS